MRPYAITLAALLLAASPAGLTAQTETPEQRQPDRQQEPEQQEPDQPSRSRTQEQLGIEFAVLSSKIRRRIIRTDTPWGFAVRAVAPGSLAAQAGIAKGTIVLEVNGVPLKEVAELEAVLAEAKPGEKIELLCAARKKERRLLDRQPWVEKEVELVLPKADEEGVKGAGKEAGKGKVEKRRSYAP